MKAELKQKWIDALRSGDYQQVRDEMNSEQGNCCLGVLCRIAGATFEDYHDEDASLNNVAVLGSRLLTDDSNELTGTGLQFFGLRRSDQKTLITLNDGFKLDDPAHKQFAPAKSFSEIADYIEANIPADDHSVTEVV